ncbi:MAG: helix-turn-helix domain-containing protein [Nanoarchaeota archaeon]
MNEEILEDLGLTSGEIKVYISLLEIGSSTAGPIIEKSKLQHSVVHRALNSLINKGLISYILEGKRKIYQASDPENFYSFIEEKKERFSEILPELKKKQLFSKTEENATIYRGIRGIKEVYNIMINAKGKEYLTFGGGPPAEKLMGLTWWLNLHNKRIANKLPSRQVFDESVKNIGGKDISKKKLTQIRYLTKEFAQFQETVMVGDYVAIAVFTENPYAFLIKDKYVAEGYRKHFEVLWKQAKK